jgi:ADP-ribose pyrophosphatase
MDETLLHEELIYTGRVIRLYKETTRLPNDQIATRDVVRHNGAVALIPVLPNGDILMVRQYRVPARRTLLEIPAGGLEVGEDPVACAMRECQEETGYKPGRLDSLGGVYLAPGYSTEFIHFYLATELIESKLPGDADEFLEIVAYSLPELLTQIGNGTICDAKSVSAILMYAQRRTPTP